MHIFEFKTTHRFTEHEIMNYLKSKKIKDLDHFNVEVLIEQIAKNEGINYYDIIHPNDEEKKEIIEEARIVLDEIRRGVRIEKGFEYLKE